jgi:hypothetical protein
MSNFEGYGWQLFEGYVKQLSELFLLAAVLLAVATTYKLDIPLA